MEHLDDNGIRLRMLVDSEHASPQNDGTRRLSAYLSFEDHDLVAKLRLEGVSVDDLKRLTVGAEYVVTIVPADE